MLESDQVQARNDINSKAPMGDEVIHKMQYLLTFQILYHIYIEPHQPWGQFAIPQIFAHDACEIQHRMMLPCNINILFRIKLSATEGLAHRN